MSVAAGKGVILVVENSADTLEFIQRNLSAAGYRIFMATSVEEAMRLLEKTEINLVITDNKAPELSGLDLVRHVRNNYRGTEIIMITRTASISGAVEAVTAGATDYLARPLTVGELNAAVDRAFGKINARRTMEPRLQSALPEQFGLIGKSSVMRRVFEAVEKVANSPATVLLTGESGTGKELVARAIHYTSSRNAASFVPINCGGIPESLLESELFGHVKGAFTGASETRAGFFQTADGGTIFLDEISETSLNMQVKLLRVLQDKQVCMVGDNKSRQVDVRIISATNKNLDALIKKNLFRHDLFFRISVITINIPPLRERGDDILLLARHFVRKFGLEMGGKDLQFSDEALNIMQNYDWPGNVRELENVIQRMVIMADGNIINVPDLPSFMRYTARTGGGMNRTLSEVEGEHIRNVLASVDNNKSRAAAMLGIDRKTLRAKMNKYRIQ